MAALDFTNVIGKNFSKYVVDQLAQRSIVLAKGAQGERSNAELQWLTNRSGWLRVTSNVDIKVDNPLASKYGSGDSLAKKYILQGGVVYSSATANNGSVLRSGIGADKAYGVGFQNGDSNGLGMGLKPMPGVTSFNISCDGPYGALKTANIKVKAYDLEQFNIIETLYCHLGLSLIIEYGHIPYLKNNGSIETNVSVIDVFNIKDKEQLAAAITQQRRSTDGNYDALFGTLVNYSWSSNNDGSYDIDLKVTGPGSVVESLNINYSTSNLNNLLKPSSLPIYKEFLEQYNANKPAEAATPPPPTTTTPDPSTQATGTPASSATTADEAAQIAADAAQAAERNFLPGVIASRNNSTIHRHLYTLYENALTTQQVQNPADGGGDKAIRATLTPSITNNIFTENKSYNFLTTAGGFSGNQLALRGNNFAAISGQFPLKEIPVINSNLFNYFTIAYVTNPDIGEANSNATTKDQLPKVYIPFGYFLAIIQCSGMIYNTSKGDNDGDKTKPFVYLDFNNKTNFCFANPYSVSVDPSVCLVNIADGNALNSYLFGGKAIGKDGKQILKPTLSQIGADNKYDPAADILSKQIASKELKFWNEGNQGFLMNVLLNIEYIVNKMDSLAGTEADKSVKLDKFLHEILQDVNNALGGINEFRVAFNDESYCIQLMDDQRIGQPAKPAIIDVIGLSSIVQNYSFTSKISPKLASMLIIGSQAAGKSTKAAGIDASAIGKWNEYVKDRIMPVKQDSTNETGEVKTPETPPEGEGEPESPDDQLSRHIKGIYQVFKYSEADIEGARTTLKEKLLAIKADSEDTEAAALIPLEMSIKMDGISGILVNQTFVIPPERLPLSYQDKMGSGKTKLGFIVLKIENAIENNKWITTLSGQSLNLKEAVNASVKRVNTQAPTPTPSPTPSSSGTRPAQTTDPTVQRQEQENLQRITVPNSGKNTTANTYTYLPKTTTKEVNVFVFYPGVDIGGIVGRDYMPQKVTAAAPDWFDKYVLVFPTTWTTSFSSVKREYQELLTKAGLTAKTINIGIYSGSGNNSASVLAAVKSSGRELRNFIMMDPVPSDTLTSAVQAVIARGGTFQYLYYNPAAWGGASYYGGANVNGVLYGNIKTLVDAGAGKVGTKKTSTGHYDIPRFMLLELKSQIEKNLV
jgi:hypothetical protein